jgi:hypothetical protein
VPDSIRISPTLTLPPDAVTQTFAFLARRGAGKSYGAMKLAEGMLDAEAQIVALDPVGVWYSLRIAADGKGKGYDLLILGGLHGDIPLEPGGGAFIADLIVDRGISAVIDVSHFRKNDRKRFATDFAEQLFHRKKARRSPLHLFVEEAQVFVPQRAMGDEARMLGAFEDIIKLGRNFGIGATLISQRPQAVNKDALNQTEALFVLQTNGSQERKALEAWIVEQGVESKTIVDELPGLPIGTAYLWSPSWLRKLEKVEIGKRRTYNASATPVAGQERVEPRPLSRDEMAKVKDDMAATIERAKADDPKALRAEIIGLKKQLATAGTADPAEVRQLRDRVAELEARPPERVDVPVLRDGEVAALGAVAETLNAAVEAIVGGLNRIVATRHVAGPIPARQAPVARREPPRPTECAPTRREAPQRAANASRDDRRFRAGARRILQACAQFPDRGVTKPQIVALAKVKAGGTFSTYFGELTAAGFVKVHGGRCFATSDGLAYLGGDVPPIPRTVDDVISRWREEFRDGARRMLDVIVEAHPHPVSRADLSVRARVANGGTFSTYLGELKRAELVDENDHGAYLAIAELI